MTDPTYLDLRNNVITRVHAADASTGTADAGKVIALNADGELDESLSPALRQVIFSQGVALADWVIDHNLHRFPSVEVVDSTNRLVEGDVEYVNSNRIIIHFAAAFSGTAYIN